MANNEFLGNSEGSIFRGADGNAYQVINGQNVRVPQDRLMIAGLPPGSLPGIYGGELNLGTPSQNQGGLGSPLMLVVVGAIILLVLGRK